MILLTFELTTKTDHLNYMLFFRLQQDLEPEQWDFSQKFKWNMCLDGTVP